MDFYQELRFRKEIKELFTSLNRVEWTTLSTDQLRRWLTTSQRIHFASDKEVRQQHCARCCLAHSHAAV